MAEVIDSCIWIDFFRERTPRATRELAHEVIHTEEALLCEQVRFELLAGASHRERKLISDSLDTMPMLQTPPSLWRDAAALGLKAFDAGLKTPPLDLLIAALCVHHRVTLATFDKHFVKLANISNLQVNLLVRPV